MEDPDGPPGSVRLACAPASEAAMYRGFHRGWDHLAEVACPTLVVVGEETSPMSHYGMTADSWRECARRVQRGAFATVAKAGHLLIMEQPDECARLAFEHLRPVLLAAAR